MTVQVSPPKPQPIPQLSQGLITRYKKQFADRLARSVQKSLADVKAHRYTIPKDMQEQAWHTLDMLFDGNLLWAEASELLIELAPRMEMAGERDEWIPYLEGGIALSVEREDELVEAKLRYYLGQLYRLMGSYNEASGQLGKSEILFDLLGEPSCQAMVLNERAYLAYFRSDFAATTAFAEGALVLFRNDEHERAVSHYHLAKVASHDSNGDLAREHFEIALDIRRTSNDARGIAANLRNLATMATWQQKYDVAQTFFEEVISLQDKLHDPIQHAITQLEFGIVLRRSGKIESAIACYQRAEATFREVSDLDHLAATYNNLANAFADLSRFDDAVTMANSSINLRRTQGQVVELANAMDTLGAVYMTSGEYQAAKTILEDAIEVIQVLPNVASLRISGMLEDNLSKAKRLEQMECA